MCTCVKQQPIELLLVFLALLSVLRGRCSLSPAFPVDRVTIVHWPGRQRDLTPMSRVFSKASRHEGAETGKETHGAACEQADREQEQRRPQALEHETDHERDGLTSRALRSSSCTLEVF